MQIKARSRLWLERVIGDPALFSMESRLFNAVCFISLFGLALTTLFDYILKLPILSVAMFLIFCLVAFIYYLCRFKKRLFTAVLLFAVFSNILFSFNFYYNSGLNGPTLLIFILGFSFLLSMSPKSSYRFWIPMNIGTVFTLLLISYYYPNWIKDTYADRGSRFVDFAFSYLLIVILIFTGIFFIRKSYDYEKQLAEKRARELAEINEAKNKMFSIIAHDLRSPINSLQNYLEIFDEFRSSGAERKEMEKELLAATKNTSEMLSNLLSWTRTQMEGISACLTTIYPKEALANTLEIQASIAKEKGIDLVSRIDKDACAIADANMLELIVRNLINNAIKFTLPGGDVFVEAKIINEQCRISVRDTGIGMNPESTSNLFSLKSKSTFGTRREKGVGLGLVLCKNYVELQNGKIWYESTLNVGTTFHIDLPSCKSFKNNKDFLQPVKKIRTLIF